MVRRNSLDPPVVAMQRFDALHPAIMFCLVTDRRDVAERVRHARAMFATLRSGHPDERVYLFVLCSDAEPSRTVLEYYSGTPWDWTGEVKRIDGVGIASSSFVDMGGDG